MDFLSVGIIASVIVAAIVVIGIIMTSLYTRATRDKAYVRIFSAGGLAGALGGAQAGQAGSPVGDLASQLLSFSAQKPILDEILSQAGFNGADPTQALLAASLGDKVLKLSDAKPQPPVKSD